MAQSLPYFSKSDVQHLNDLYLLIKYFLKKIIYIWLHWVFIALLKLSLVVVPGPLIVVASLGAQQSSRVQGLQQFQYSGSVAVAQGFSYPSSCGIFLDQDLNPCHLHWQVDSYPPHHQGSPRNIFLIVFNELKVMIKCRLETKFSDAILWLLFFFFLIIKETIHLVANYSLLDGKNGGKI